MRKQLLAGLGLWLAASACSWAGHPFAGFGVGHASLINTQSGRSFDGNSVGAKVFFGWQFLNLVSAEVVYSNLGSFSETVDTTTVDAEAQTFAAWAILHAPIGDHFLFLAKLGVAQTEADVTVDDGTGPRPDSGSDTGVAWALGFGYRFGKRATLRLEFENYDTDTLQTVEFLSLGAQFNF